ncbi:MAG: cation transporter [Candidatus Omnitrophica bacterium]|nr:cation transporter [Candidatus Omnitrophota bacterium]
MEQRYGSIRNVLIIVLALNWGVSIMKVIFGVASGSGAIMADGFHSFSDGISNIVGLVGIWVASHPVDKDHPYGHKKYETFTSIVIAITLFVVASQLLREASGRIIHPVAPHITISSFIVMILTLGVNVWVVIYELAQARRLNSDVLAADALHTRSDILVSLSVIVSLVAVRAGFTFVDALVTIVIALFIGYSAFMILRESSAILCDREAIISDKINELVLRIEGVKDCHRIRTRGRSDDIYIDMHVLVSKDMNIQAAHDLSETVEKEIKEKLKGVTDVTIHIEPWSQDFDRWKRK